MSSDQRFTRITSTGQVQTIGGGSTAIGPARITYIQAKGHASGQLELRDSADNSGKLLFIAHFGTEGLDIYVPGNGIRFETSVHATISGTGSVTLGYTG
jgi:hypothetical protein